MNKVNGYVVAIGVGVIALWYLKGKVGAVAGAVVDSVNPASQNNLVNRGYTAVVGEKKAATIGDYIFGLRDLANPFNEDDTYAKQVYGIDKGQAWVKSLFGFGESKAPAKTENYTGGDYQNWVNSQREGLSE